MEILAHKLGCAALQKTKTGPNNDVTTMTKITNNIYSESKYFAIVCINKTQTLFHECLCTLLYFTDEIQLGFDGINTPNCEITLSKSNI